MNQTKASMWIDVFKSGKYPQGTFNEEYLQKIADNYDINYFKAPLTIDHEDKGPAFGWVKAVKHDDGILYVMFESLSKEIINDVNEGKYANRSIEIYENLDGIGPYLKAVTLLGAGAPAVKGLKTFKFNDEKGQYMKFSSTSKQEDDISSYDKATKTISFEEMVYSEEPKQVIEAVKMFNELMDENTKHKSALEKLEQKYKELESRIRKEKVSEEVKRFLEESKISPQNEKDALTLLVHDDETVNNAFRNIMNNNDSIYFKEITGLSHSHHLEPSLIHNAESYDSLNNTIIKFMEANNINENQYHNILDMVIENKSISGKEILDNLIQKGGNNGNSI